MEFILWPINYPLPNIGLDFWNWELIVPGDIINNMLCSYVIISLTVLPIYPIGKGWSSIFGSRWIWRMMSFELLGWQQRVSHNANKYMWNGEPHCLSVLKAVIASVHPVNASDGTHTILNNKVGTSHIAYPDNSAKCRCPVVFLLWCAIE